MYGPPGDDMKLGTPSTPLCEDGPELNWYDTPLPASASMWGVSASRLGWLPTCCAGAFVEAAAATALVNRASNAKMAATAVQRRKKRIGKRWTARTGTGRRRGG